MTTGIFSEKCNTMKKLRIGLLCCFPILKTEDTLSNLLNITSNWLDMYFNKCIKPRNKKI